MCHCCRKFETTALNGSDKFIGVCIIDVIRETTTLVTFDFISAITNGFVVFIEGDLNSVNRNFFTNVGLCTVS